jgi:hypothetical protein
MAVKQRNSDIVQEIVQKDNSLINQANGERGFNVLRLALHDNIVDIIDILTQHGASFDIVNAEDLANKIEIQDCNLRNDGTLHNPQCGLGSLVDIDI